jgi:hypothetical protein
MHWARAVRRPLRTIQRQYLQPTLQTKAHKSWHGMQPLPCSLQGQHQATEHFFGNRLTDSGVRLPLPTQKSYNVYNRKLCPWYVPNTVIQRDLQTPTAKEEIRRYSSQYSAHLSAHPNGLVVNPMDQSDNRRLRRHLPNDLPVRFLV